MSVPLISTRDRSSQWRCVDFFIDRRTVDSNRDSFNGRLRNFVLSCSTLRLFVAGRQILLGFPFFSIPFPTPLVAVRWRDVLRPLQMICDLFTAWLSSKFSTPILGVYRDH